MKIAFDIGGVISKYPHHFREMALKYADYPSDVYVITDMHKHAEVVEMLKDNGFEFVLPENVHCADYTKHGEYCKAILLKQLGIDIFIDDFVGYLQWDSSLGEAPLRLLVAPDGFKPYWANEWRVKTTEDFGRRVISLDAVLDVLARKDIALKNLS